MADISKIKLPSGTEYNVKDANAARTSHTHSGYKTIQSAISDPTASGTSITFIDTISQNANGVITPTKKTVSTATTSAAGLMSSNDKTKLNGIASGAEVNVNADWNATSGDAQILNKPTEFNPMIHGLDTLPGDLQLGDRLPINRNMQNYQIEYDEFAYDLVSQYGQDMIEIHGIATKTYVDNHHDSTKADASTTYTKTEVDTALGGKANTSHTHTKSQITDFAHTHIKSEVGLENVDNTSDATKKTNFTGTLETGNTGFATGGDVYDAFYNHAVGGHPGLVTTRSVSASSKSVAANSNASFSFTAPTVAGYSPVGIISIYTGYTNCSIVRFRETETNVYAVVLKNNNSTSKDSGQVSIEILYIKD